MPSPEFIYDGIVIKSVLKPQYGFTVKSTIRDTIKFQLEELGKPFSEEAFEAAYEGFNYVEFSLEGVLSRMKVE